MTQAKRNWELLNEEERKAAIDEIINFYSTERNEEIGVIAAGNLLDMFQQQVGVVLYNKGVEDTKSFVKTRLEEVEMDIEVSLKK
jgi:uncharacterized protein (DUF2164 family)